MGTDRQQISISLTKDNWRVIIAALHTVKRYSDFDTRKLNRIKKKISEELIK